jgi:hypothetical protein
MGMVWRREKRICQRQNPYTMPIAVIPMANPYIMFIDMILDGAR